MLAWLAREKQNILTGHSHVYVLSCKLQTLLSANQSARTILVILQNEICINLENVQEFSQQGKLIEKVTVNRSEEEIK